MTPEKALNTVAAMCSKKEYCTREIQEKLRNWEIPGQEITRILDFLHKNNFVDDRRFAKFYARDKFRFNKWGKQKITLMLRQKGITADVIREALSQLEPEAYDRTCYQLLQQKLKTTKEEDPQKLKAKLIRFAAGRGFDFDVIHHCLYRLLSFPADETDNFS